jgi:hypothetical protein
LIHPKTYSRRAGRFIIICFLLFSCIYNAGYFSIDIAISSLIEKAASKGENKPGSEEETHVVKISPEQQRCQSPVKTPQKQQRLLKASLDGSSHDSGKIAALRDGFLEKPYYYILLFRHNLF